MATGLFKIALVFVSIMVATMELSDARPNMDSSEVFKFQPLDKFLGQQLQPEQVEQRDLEVSKELENKKTSRSKRFGGGINRCKARYGADEFNIHMSQDFLCGCLYPPCKHPGMNGK